VKRQSERGILESLTASGCFINADSVLCYVSTPEEVSTDDLIRLLQTDFKVKTLAVPRVSGDEMDFYVIHSREDLEPGHFGILEPKAHCEPFRSYRNTICITPGLIFTEDGYRLGYGKGYYDKFFEEHPELLKIGLSFENNIHPKNFMKIDKFDIPVDIIITERRVIDVRQRT
jgi:5-formyltetrahydrofolate cyclo-ligase